MTDNERSLSTVPPPQKRLLRVRQQHEKVPEPQYKRPPGSTALTARARYLPAPAANEDPRQPQQRQHTRFGQMMVYVKLGPNMPGSAAERWTTGSRKLLITRFSTKVMFGSGEKPLA